MSVRWDAVRNEVAAMPRINALGFAATLCAGLLAACEREAEAPPAAPTAASLKSPDSLTPMSAEERAQITASYACEGHRVDVVRDKIARIALSDGRIVHAEVVDGSVPRTFTDNGLTLIVAAPDKVELSDEKNRAISCVLVPGGEVG